MAIPPVYGAPEEGAKGPTAKENEMRVSDSLEELGKKVLLWYVLEYPIHSPHHRRGRPWPWSGNGCLVFNCRINTSLWDTTDERPVKTMPAKLTSFGCIRECEDSVSGLAHRNPREMNHPSSDPHSNSIHLHLGMCSACHKMEQDMC